LYALLNGLSLQFFNCQHRWPFGSNGYESTQTPRGMRRALGRAGFTDIVVVTRGPFLVATARKA
jgi:hypothetical protein